MTDQTARNVLKSKKNAVYHIECASCGKKEGIKQIHIETNKVDLYIPYCPNCQGDEKKFRRALKKLVNSNQYFN